MSAQNNIKSIVLKENGDVAIVFNDDTQVIVPEQKVEKEELKRGAGSPQRDKLLDPKYSVLRGKLYNGIRSRDLLYQADVLAVRLPSNGELVHFKVKDGKEDTPLSEYIEYGEELLEQDQFDVHGQCIITKPSLFSPEAQEYLNSFTI